MSSHTVRTTIQKASGLDASLSTTLTNALTDAQPAEAAWSDERPTSFVSINACEDIEGTSTCFSNESSTLSSSPDTCQTEATEPEEDGDEEFGEFVCASTYPFKQLVYNVGNDMDGTIGLLSTKSSPEQQVGMFAGIGLIEPVRTQLDTSTRELRRAGKLALRKLQILKENKAAEEVRRVFDIGLTRLHGSTCEDAEELVHTVADVQVVPQEVSYEEDKVLEPVTPVVNWVMRPVSLARPRFNENQKKQLSEIDEMMEKERMTWVGPHATADMP